MWGGGATSLIERFLCFRTKELHNGGLECIQRDAEGERPTLLKKTQVDWPDALSVAFLV